MLWKPIAYALLCVVVPVAWGLVVYWASSMVERRVLVEHNPISSEKAAEGTTLPLDYYI